MHGERIEKSGGNKICNETNFLAMRIDCSEFNYNDSIGMIAFVRSDLCPNGEALNTKVKIGTFCTFDTDDA